MPSSGGEDEAGIEEKKRMTEAKTGRINLNFKVVVLISKRH